MYYQRNSGKTQGNDTHKERRNSFTLLPHVLCQPKHVTETRIHATTRILTSSLLPVLWAYSNGRTQGNDRHKEGRKERDRKARVKPRPLCLELLCTYCDAQWSRQPGNKRRTNQEPRSRSFSALGLGLVCMCVGLCLVFQRILYQN